MSKSAWLIAITSGLVLVSLLAGAFAIRALEKRYASDRENVAYQYDSSDKRILDECFRRRGITSITDCVVETVAAKQEAQTSYQDLKAQQHMSLSALGVLIVSAVTMIVTAVGVVFVWRTLVETRRMGEVQTRAYVGLSDYDYIDGAEPKFSLIIRNSGNSPAFKCRFIADFTISKPTGPLAFPEKKIGKKSVFPLSAGQEKTISLTLGALSDDGREAFYSGKLVLWVRLYIEYVDVFGETRTSHSQLISFAKHVGEDPIWTIIWDDENNDST